MYSPTVNLKFTKPHRATYTPSISADGPQFYILFIIICITKDPSDDLFVSPHRGNLFCVRGGEIYCHITYWRCLCYWLLHRLFILNRLEFFVVAPSVVSTTVHSRSTYFWSKISSSLTARTRILTFSDATQRYLQSAGVSRSSAVGCQLQYKQQQRQQ